MNTSRILELAAAINKATETIHKTLVDKGQGTPSFDPDAAQVLPAELTEAQDAVLDATAELHDLLLGPFNLLYRYGGHNNMVCLQAIHRYGIAKSFATKDQVSFGEIAKSTGLEESIAQRLLRHAMTMRIFSEPSEGMVAHTAASALLAKPAMHHWIGVGSNEMWPAAVKVVDALGKWPGSEEPTQTGFALANNEESSLYQIVASDPARAMQFAGAMEAYTSEAGFDVAHVLDNFDWEAARSMVDMGGARGHVAIPLAKRYPLLNVLVQDMEQVIQGASAEVPADLIHRVRFTVHDLFAKQSVEADVYYFRWIFHNWSKKYALEILRNLVPALRSGARVLINDICLPELGEVPTWRERDLRSNDLNMLAIFNSQERSAKDWQALFEEADARFSFRGIIKPRGSTLVFIEAWWVEDA